VQRDTAQEKILAANGGKLPTNGAATPAGAATRPQLVQGVYVLQTDHKKQHVRFVPVTTGITGSTDIEVLSGLKDGDQIVTGRYRILRGLKSGTAVKVDNTVEVTETEKS
jgi:HlyD family secretion protein